MTLDEFRSHFASDSGLIHFNNAGQAPIPDVNRDCAIEWLKRLHREGAACSMEGWAEAEKARQRLARFLGAAPDELAFMQTTASALSQAALGLPLEEGDEILTWDQEYPSNFYPWRQAAERARARLIQVQSDGWQTPASRLLEQVTPRTKVIAVSWIQYQTGAVTDLQMLSRELKGRGIWLVADVIQGAGVRPFNFKDSGFDVICGGSHKWLCSNYGVGFMTVRRERLQELRPLEFGAMTYGNPETPKSFANEPKTSAARFEPGSRALIEAIAMIQTLDLLEKTGTAVIFEESCRLADQLRQGLRKLGYKHFCDNGPIVNFSPNGNDGISKALDRARISHALRGPGIRLSLHAFNTGGEVDRVLDVLRAFKL